MPVLVFYVEKKLDNNNGSTRQVMESRPNRTYIDHLDRLDLSIDRLSRSYDLLLSLDRLILSFIYHDRL